MTAPVRIDALAWGDLRFATLARLCGFADAEHALIKCAKIWSWQTEHFTFERPTYVVDVDIVESALGVGGADHLVRARLAETGPDGLRMRGSEGRIEWLHKNRNSSAKGGEATKRKHADKDGPTGQALGQPSGEPTPGPETGLKQGPLTPALSPDQQISEIHTRVRERHPSAGAVARATWEYGSKVRLELAALNVNVPPWVLMPGTDHSGWVDLLDRVTERLVGSTAELAEKVCRNRIDVAAAKARADGEGNWFASTGMFTRKSFDMFAELDPKQFGRKAAQKTNFQPSRGGAIGAATPRTDHGEEMKPAREVM